MNTTKRSIALSKVKKYVNKRKKKLRFDLNVNLHRPTDLREDLTLLVQQNWEPCEVTESEVWCEKFGGDDPVNVHVLTEETFWDFVYSDKWSKYSSLRVCEGALLDRLVENLCILVDFGKALTYTVSRFDHRLKDDPQSCLVQTNAAASNQVKEELKISLTYYGPSEGNLENSVSFDGFFYQASTSSSILAYARSQSLDSQSYLTSYSSAILPSVSHTTSGSSEKEVKNCSVEVQYSLGSGDSSDLSFEIIAKSHSNHHYSTVTTQQTGFNNAQLEEHEISSDDSSTTEDLKDIVTHNPKFPSDPLEDVSTEKKRDHTHDNKDYIHTAKNQEKNSPDNAEVSGTYPLRDRMVSFVNRRPDWSVENISSKVVVFDVQRHQRKVSVVKTSSSLSNQHLINIRRGGLVSGRLVPHHHILSAIASSDESDDDSKYGTYKSRICKKKTAAKNHASSLYRKKPKVSDSSKIEMAHTSVVSTEPVTQTCTGSREKVTETQNLQENTYPERKAKNEAHILKLNQRKKTKKLFNSSLLNRAHSIDNLRKMKLVELESTRKEDAGNRRRNIIQSVIHNWLERKYRPFLKQKEEDQRRRISLFYGTSPTHPKLPPINPEANHAYPKAVCPCNEEEIKRIVKMPVPKFFKHRYPSDFQKRCQNAMTDFVIRKEQVTMWRGEFKTLTTITINRIIPFRY